MNREALLTSLESLVTALKEQGNTNHDGEYIRKVFALGYLHGVHQQTDHLQNEYVEIEQDVDLYADGLNISGSIDVDQEAVYNWLRRVNLSFTDYNQALRHVTSLGFDIDDAVAAALDPNYDASKVV
jgi:predicted DNA-binding protein YlxM (UPF0122 family)